MVQLIMFVVSGSVFASLYTLILQSSRECQAKLDCKNIADDSVSSEAGVSG